MTSETTRESMESEPAWDSMESEPAWDCETKKQIFCSGECVGEFSGLPDIDSQVVSLAIDSQGVSLSIDSRVVSLVIDSQIHVPFFRKKNPENSVKIPPGKN